MNLFYSDESKKTYILLFVQHRRPRYEIHFSQVMLLILRFGQWVLNVDTYMPVHYHLDEANEFMDVVLSHYPKLGSLHNYIY